MNFTEITFTIWAFENGKKLGLDFSQPNQLISNFVKCIQQHESLQSH